MIPLLYFHGFASSPKSQKVESLRTLLLPDDIVLNTPDLNIPSFASLDFDAIVARGCDEARRHPPRAITGSSLGALVALAVSQTAPDIPLVLIAPAIGVRDRWLDRIPNGDPILVHHHAHNVSLPIHRAFFERMANVDVDRQPPPARVTVIMGRLDESVPFDRVASVWDRWKESGQLAQGSAFVEIPDGDHGLTAHVDLIAREIVKAVAA